MEFQVCPFGEGQPYLSERNLEGPLGAATLPHPPRDLACKGEDCIELEEFFP